MASYALHAPSSIPVCYYLDWRLVEFGIIHPFNDPSVSLAQASWRCLTSEAFLFPDISGFPISSIARS